MWSTTELDGAWTREDLGTSVDLAAIDHGYYDEQATAVGAAGAVFQRRAGTWSAVDIGLSEDLIAYRDGVVLTASGRALHIANPDELRELGTYPEARALDFSHGDEVLTVGEGGTIQVRSFFGYCPE